MTARRFELLPRFGIEPTVQALVRIALDEAITRASVARAVRPGAATGAATNGHGHGPTGVAALDAGCGRMSHLRPFRDRIDRLVGVDIHRARAAADASRRVRDRRPLRPGRRVPRGIVRRRAVELHARALRRSARRAREHPAVAAAGRHARGDDREPAAPVRRGLPGAAGGSALEGPGAREGIGRGRASPRRRVQHAGRDPARPRRGRLRVRSTSGPSAISPGHGAATCRPSPWASRATCSRRACLASLDDRGGREGVRPGRTAGPPTGAPDTPRPSRVMHDLQAVSLRKRHAPRLHIRWT